MPLSRDEYRALKDRCSSKFYAARKAGKIPAVASDAKCVDCGKKAVMYDHRNYYKPYEVEPVCRKCNSARGQAYPYCEDWWKQRAGLETLQDEPLDYTGYLAIDFDFDEYDRHLEYLHYFSKDPELNILKEELNKRKAAPKKFKIIIFKGKAHFIPRNKYYGY